MYRIGTFLFACILAFVLLQSVEAADRIVTPLMGGVNGVKPADNDVALVVSQAQSGLNTVLNLSASSNTKVQPISYRTQVVAGTNFFVKIAAVSDAGTTFAHCRLFRPLPPRQNEIEVVKCVAAQEDSPLNYF